MENQAQKYSELRPPENQEYPWRPGEWQQLLCYYCAQPIYLTKPKAGLRQRTVYMRGGWRHVAQDKLHCDTKKLRPNEEIDDPRCGCCETQTDRHKGSCSAAAKPPYRATPMSDKETELIKTFGW